MQIPGFRQKMNDGWYQIRIAGQDVDETTLSARLHEPLPDGSIIHIVPRMAGAKSGGMFQVVLGAVAIGASFLTAGASMAAWGAALSAGAFSASSVLFSLGAAMMLGGVAQMLTPQAKTLSSRQTDNGKQNTYFSSLDNMIAQGNPMPVPYGEIMVGSRRVSQTLSTRDESSPEKVINFGGRRSSGGVKINSKAAERWFLENMPGIMQPRVIIR